ncbi:calpain-like cysteine peptidase [Trypanosoma theileri]|uniref:Calpain-like cysteine peptidase n=1 Tax=Trypanosoma theileri TaxID=67003 RepID=A0A1X0NJK2_9TRYP|nr:calpain-like cysteine peptidase [Trypanosoma theileri]ORC84771.1 calpain-like cysteine peptidase [Trypanosoma theileri]
MGTCCGVQSRSSRYRLARRNAAGNSRRKLERLRAKRAHKFKYGGPTERGNAFPLFDDGMCYRVECGNEWFIYNDTVGSEVHVMMRFNGELNLRGSPRTELKRDGKQWVANIIVYPLETASFVKLRKGKDKKKGELVDMGFKCFLRPLAADYLKKVNSKAESKVRSEMLEVSRISSGGRYSEEELLYLCRSKKKKMFVDLKFPPISSSLQQSSDKKKIVYLDSITWKRPSDYVPPERHKDIQLFRNGIDPQDIDQGQLGDCWLMCVLSVLADRSSMVKSIFRHPISSSKAKKEQKYGAYRVNINKHGWWENVIVDSYLPTMNCQPIFGKCSDDPCELWVSLVEKAYAKLHGSYASIIGGDALLAFQDLTGFPVISFDSMWKDAVHDSEAASRFFKMLRGYKKKGYVITIGTPGTDTSAYTGLQQSKEPFHQSTKNSNNMQELYKRAGLGMGHAYSVLDVRQFSFPNIKLLKVRNPWGAGGGEWTGAWSDSSDKWKQHPLVRRACKPTKKDDGTFWMEWSDIVRFFNSGGVCMVERNWHDYRIPGRFSGVVPSVVLRVSVKRSTRVVFILSQQDKRATGVDGPYAAFLITVAGPASTPGTYTHQLIACSTNNIDVDVNNTNIKKKKNDKKKKNKKEMIYSSYNILSDTNAFTFAQRRDVAVRLTLEPSPVPYIVVPRIMSTDATSQPRPFTLAMLTPRKAGNGITAEFVHLPENHSALQNVRTYNMDSGIKPMVLEFQHKKPGEVASLRKGSNLHQAKKVG